MEAIPKRIPKFIYALEEINSLPVNWNNPLFRRYPGMKMGNPGDIRFFSQQLATLANGLIQSSSSQEEWMITAPPYFQLPAAANFLARQVQDLLRQEGSNVSLHELRLLPENKECTTDDFNNSFNYSKSSLRQRTIERARIQQKLDTENLEIAFEGKPVIIINDINVTGIQQYFIQKTMDQMNAKHCYWIYIFNVEKGLGSIFPEIEHQINTSQIADLDTYASLLGNPHTLHTARCISRLFNESLENFQYLIDRIDYKARLKIHSLAWQEQKYCSSIFQQKMDLLTRFNNEISFLN